MTHSIEVIDGMQVYRANPPCPETDVEALVVASAFALQVVEAFPEQAIITVLNSTRAAKRSFIETAVINNNASLIITMLEDKNDEAADHLNLIVKLKTPNIIEDEFCVLEVPQCVAESIVAKQPRFEDLIDMPAPILPVVKHWKYHAGIKNINNTKDGRVNWTGVRGVFSEETAKTQRVKFIGTPRDVL